MKKILALNFILLTINLNACDYPGERKSDDPELRITPAYFKNHNRSRRCSPATSDSESESDQSDSLTVISGTARPRRYFNEKTGKLWMEYGADFLYPEKGLDRNADKTRDRFIKDQTAQDIFAAGITARECITGFDAAGKPIPVVKGWTGQSVAASASIGFLAGVATLLSTKR